jgi:RnfABCDGE-type electron transport complex C subunit
MNKQEILQKIKDAGIVGAGGAGFPTHIKLNCKAEFVIANAAECEPLLRTDRLLMEHHADKVVAGLKAAMTCAEAKNGVIAIKAKYHKAIDALEAALAGDKSIEIMKMKGYYPAGDEQQIVYQATGWVVPTGGLPLDVGCVVQNVATLANIADALEGRPVIEKYVTVNGEVADPATFKVPIGTSVRTLIEAAGGPKDLSGYSIIIGGPLMGRVTDNPDEPVQKTTGGILVFAKDHPLIAKKTGNPQTDLRLAKSVCCQCTYCTQLCPRNALGLKVEPHKIMRALAMNAPEGMGDVNGVFSCCDCGICTLYACNFSLAPSRMMQRVKQELMAAGVKPVKKVANEVSDNLDDIKVPVSRLLMRLGIDKYDRDLSLKEEFDRVASVKLPLKMHIGAPAKPLVKTGDRVEKGQLIASVDAGVGANVHASISGTATVTDKAIEIAG